MKPAKTWWRFLYRFEYDRAGHWITMPDTKHRLYLTLYAGSTISADGLRLFMIVVGLFFLELAASGKL